MNKYRVHEVAKDFKMNSKDIAEIMTKYSQAPKNHMQVLEDRELAIVFDYLTQNNQVESMESVFADTYREPKASAPAAPKAAPAKAAAPQNKQGAQQPKADNKPEVKAEKPAKAEAKPQNQPKAEGDAGEKKAKNGNRNRRRPNRPKGDKPANKE